MQDRQRAPDIVISGSARPRRRQTIGEPLSAGDWAQEIASLIAAIAGGAGIVLGAAALGDAIRQFFGL